MSDIGRWGVIDAKAEKYNFATPYCYALNNSLKFVDVDGKDVALLIAKDGAGGYGHMGAIVQDGNGTWYYMTVGNADPNAGMSKMTTSGSQGGMVLQSLETKNKDEAIAKAKEDANNSPYTDQVEFSTSKKMDEKIFKNAEELKEKVNSGEKKYNVLTNNCAEAAQGVIEEGTGVSLKSGYSPKPNERFKNIKKNKEETQKKIDSKAKKDESHIEEIPSKMDNYPAQKILVPNN